MHGHEAGGVNTGALVLALPLIVLGVILFFQKTAAPIVSAVLVLGGLIVAIGGFTFLKAETDGHQHTEAAPPGTDYADAVAALCEARQAKPDEAADLFLDRAHGPLHELADEIASEDREATAELLEAKQEVEHALESPEHGAGLRRDLDRLIETTVASLSLIDVEVEACV